MAQLRYMSARDLANQRSAGAERLAWIRHQVQTGELVIRQATPEERIRYGIPEGARVRSARAGKARGAGRRQGPAAPASRASRARTASQSSSAANGLASAAATP